MLHEAICFAANAHARQTRKGSATPYITHPFEVAQILTAAGADEAVIIAGLLHDTLEDTDTSPEDISSRFGLEVLGLVLSDSEDKTKSWEERKSATIHHMTEKATYEELLLAAADKLSNLRTIAADLDSLGDEVWNRFKRGKDKQQWYYRSLLDAFRPLEDLELYEEMERLYQEIFES